ncbi:MAG: response regulator, partial [Bradyrhizobium sp.]|nr:response regulator [Bradyrhizobium sp.]
MTSVADYQIFEAGDVVLQSGATVPSLRLAYKTYGTLNAAKDNVILYPTSFSAQHVDTEWLVGPADILDSDRYFIIIPNLFGNGLSSSPSNTPPADAPFPAISYHDAVAIQRRLVENMVQKCGYEAIVVDTGDAVIEKLTHPDAGPIDAIVLDLVMPGLDGMGVLSKMREAGISIPVIVQTAHGGIDNVVSAMRAGAQDFVVKPV